MSRLAALALLVTAAVSLRASAAETEIKTEEQKTLYAFGQTIGRNLATLNLTPAELECLKKGLSDAVTGAKPIVKTEDYSEKLQAFVQARTAARAANEKKAAEAFLEKAAKDPDSVKLPSGLIYKQLKAGTGAQPKASDTVKVHYRGTLIDGTEFDSSYARNEPAEFPLSEVIPCWTEGVQKLKVGGKAKLICPSSIAYGDRGSPPVIPGGATLVFEVELLGITPAK